MVAALIQADLLILLSDIDGLFTDDPNTNPEAHFIDVVENLDENLLNMGKSSTGSKVGTGGMATKLTAARIATAAGADMVIANGKDFHVIHKISEEMCIRDRSYCMHEQWKAYCDRKNRHGSAGAAGGRKRKDSSRWGTA